MNNLRRIPDTHRQQGRFKALFAFDKVLIHKTATGISDQITTHTSRQSFTTHLLEQRISLRHIQTLLGHSSSQTTEIYIQVSTQEIGKKPFE